MLQPLVDLGQPPMRQHRPGHAQRVGPARPHRLRGQRAGQEQGGVHRLGRRPQHRCRDGPCRAVDQPGQLGAVDHAVVQHHPHVHRSGVDLHPLPGPDCGHRAERPVRRVSHPVLGCQDLGGPSAQPVHSARRAVGLLRDRHADSVNYPLINPAGHRGLPGEPVIDQAPHTIGLIAAPQPLQCPQRHVMPGQPQLSGLRDLALPQRGDRRVVLRPRAGIRPGIGGQPAHHLGKMGFQPAGPVRHRGGQPVQQPPGRQRRPAASGHHGEARVSEQFSQRHGYVRPRS